MRHDSITFHYTLRYNTSRFSNPKSKRIQVINQILCISSIQLFSVFSVPGKYEIRVTYYGYNIPGSPFLLNIEDNLNKERGEIQLTSTDPSLDHTEDDKREWIDLPMKRRRSIKRKMSTLPSLCRLKSNTFFEETSENEAEATGHGGNNSVSPDNMNKNHEKEQAVLQQKKAIQRTVSNFYVYESTESNATEQSETYLKNNINPILTLFESFDLQQSTRRGRHRRRNLTYSNSNMKRYNKLIIENQELFQIVTKLDFVIKTLNTNELLEILSDIRNKIDLIEKYDNDIQSLRKQNVNEQKKFNGDQISLISEYFTLMHATLSKKYDNIAKLINDNIEEIDFELQQDEENKAVGENDKITKLESEGYSKENLEPKSQEENETNREKISQITEDSDILRAKRAREKFQQRGNSKKRYDQKNSTSEGMEKVDRWKESTTISRSFTDINMSPSDSSIPSEHEMDDIEFKEILPVIVKQTSQSKQHKSLKISPVPSDDEVFLESQNDLNIDITSNMQRARMAQAKHLIEKCHEDVSKGENNEKRLVRCETESLEFSNELIHNENQSELRPLECQNVKEMLNNNNMTLKDHEIFNEKMLGGEKENARDKYCIQSKKFSEEEKVEQRQTNLHIKETNFHCTANLNKNNLKMYDNEDKNERKEDYFRFYALNSEDNIECNYDLNNSQITNVSDLNNSQQTEKNDDITIGEDEKKRNWRETECENIIKNIRKEDIILNEVKCTLEDKRDDEASSSNKNKRVSENLQSQKIKTSKVKTDLQKSLNPEHNLDKEVSIKINKNDLYTGKVLTVNCPKENLGSTIQMKIELCKCSCLETINTISTQTEVDLKIDVMQENSKSIEEYSSKEGDLKEFSITKEENDTKNVTENQLHHQIESSRTIVQKTVHSIENQIKKSKHDDQHKAVDQVCENQDGNTRDDNQKEKLQKTISPKHKRKAIKNEAEKIQDTFSNAKSKMSKQDSGTQHSTILNQFHALQNKQTELVQSKSSTSDPEIPKGLVHQLIGKYNKPRAQVSGNVKEEKTMISK